MKVKITKAISEEYITRDVFLFIGRPGVYDFPDNVVKEILEDADYQGDAIDGPVFHQATKRAYRNLVNQIQEEMAIPVKPNGEAGT